MIDAVLAAARISGAPWRTQCASSLQSRLQNVEKREQVFAGLEVPSKPQSSSTMRWPKPVSVYRSMGNGAGPERIGCGVLDKSGVAVDHRNYRAPTFSLVYLLRGRGTYIDEQERTFELGPGSCVMRVPGVVHTSRPDPSSGWLECFYDLGPAFYSALAALNVVRPQPRVFFRGLDEAAVARVVELCAALQSATERELPGVAVRVLAEIVDAQAKAVDVEPSDDAIARACHALSDQASDRLTVVEWCEQQGLDYDRFRKDFQKAMGVSPAQYRIRRRIDRACQLLQTTDYTVERIAIDLGYSSPYEFSAQFTRRLGLPPSQYRVLNRPPS